MTSKQLDPSVPHPDYPELVRKYSVALDAFYGNVKHYVPRISDQSESDWQAYVGRAAFFGVVQPTVTALVGSLTRKPFELSSGEFPSTSYGSADVFLQYLFRDQFLGGRAVIQVDVDEDGKAKLINFDASNIINWGSDFAVVKECTLEKDPANRFNQVPVTRYRELYIDENGIYQNRLWEMQGKAGRGKWVAVEQPTMLVKGEPLNYLPLFPMTPFDNTWDVYTPPLFTQAAQNLQHFKQSVDLAHYAHFMALPTPVITGDLASYEEEVFDGAAIGVAAQTESGRRTVTRQANFLLGSTTQPLHLDKEATAAYLEVSGASFTMLRDNLKDIEERMFLSGSRLLSIKKGVESVEALQVRAGAESAILETVVNAAETALNKVLALVAEINRTPTQTIALNKDFTGGDMDPAQIKALLDLYAAEAITLDQFQSALYDGEVVSQPGVESSQQLT